MKKIEIIGKRKRVYTVNDEPSMTDQSFKEQADANSVIKKYAKTGIWPQPRQGQYQDLSEIPDLLQALQTVTQAQQSFEALPSEIRKRFGNSPTNLVEFLQDSQNDEEAIKLNLKQRIKADTTTIQTTTPAPQIPVPDQT